MGARKDQIKTSFPSERVAKSLQTLMERWGAKSPKAARIATDALFWTGTAALIIPFLPVPGWAVGASLIVGSVLTKLTKVKENSNP